jgi:predicted nucleotidyltransferase
MTDTLKQAITLDDLRARRDEILRLAEQYGASNVRIFGSVARGEARPDSDVDIVVDFPPKKSIFELVGLWLDLKELIGAEVSLVTDDALDGKFKSNVERDAVPL